MSRSLSVSFQLFAAVVVLFQTSHCINGFSPLNEFRDREFRSEILQKAFKEHGLRPPRLSELKSHSLKPHQIIEAVDDFIGGVMKCYDLPGMSVSFVQNDKVLLSKGYGFRDIENSLLVDENTLFGIGSTTKAFTATLAAMLVDQKMLSWDDMVADHLPFWSLYSREPARLRDLVSHRTGVPRNDLVWYSGIQESRQQAISNVVYYPPDLPFRYAFEYNNWMWGTMGSVVETLWNSTWEQIIADRIWTPLGMDNTKAFVQDAIATGNYAFPYTFLNNSNIPLPKDINTFLSIIAAAGVTSSSATDMAQWLRFQLNNGSVNGKPLLSPAALFETRRPETALPQGSTYLPFYPLCETADTYAKGWVVGTYRGYKLLWHNGGTIGHVSLVSFLPDADIGLFLSTNSQSSLAGFAQEMIQWYVFDMLLGVQPWITLQYACRLAPTVAKLSEVTPAAPPAPPVNPAVSYDVSGNYTNAAYGFIYLSPNDANPQTYDAKFNQITLTVSASSDPLTYYAVGSGDWAIIAANAMFPLTFQTDPDNPSSILSVAAPFEPNVSPYLFARVQ